MDNAADRKAIRAKEKQVRIDAASHAAVIQSVMSTVQGRAWIWSIFTSCHLFHTSFTGDALTSAFAEGERNVGQALLNQITATCPDQYIQAMRESHVRSAIDERRSSPESDGGDLGPSDDAASEPVEGSGDAPDIGLKREPDLGWNLATADDIRAAEARNEARRQAFGRST